MANSTTHGSLPYPIRQARFSLDVAFRTSAGTPTDPTTPDTEISTDGGASFADTAEEITTGGTNGAGYVTLSGAEMDNPLVWIAAKSANCLTTLVGLRPRNLAIIGSGTLSAGSAGGGTLGTLLAYDVTGCFIRTTGGTGGGGTGGANNQARRIITYNTSTGAFTVSPNWETTPDNTTTYDVLLPEGVTLGMLRALNPATPGQTVVVANGCVDADLERYAGTAVDGTNPVPAVLANTAHGGASATLQAGITGNVTGNLSGSVGSVTGAVGSVSGAVGSVTGNLGGNVNGNVVGSVGSVTGAVGSVSGAVGSVSGDVGGKVLGGGAGTITGDGVQAASVTGAVGSVTGAVGSVAGNVGGNVSGDVAGKVLGGGVSALAGDGVRAESVTGAVGSVTGAVGSVTGSVGSVTGGINTGAGTITTLDGLDTAQDTQHSTTRDAIAALNNLAASDVLAAVYEGAETLQDFLRLARAALVGKLAGAATTTVTARDKADTKNRITATVDADGNRTAVTTDAT